MILDRLRVDYLPCGIQKDDGAAGCRPDLVVGYVRQSAPEVLLQGSSKLRNIVCGELERPERPKFGVAVAMRVR